MATSVLRTMTLGQNLHMLPNNCVIMPTTGGQTPVIMQHHYQQHQTIKRPIAPAPECHQRSSGGGPLAPHDQNRSIAASSSSSATIKRKMPFTHITPFGTQPASVQRRNARERNRVKQVNNGFANLRQHIPPDVITALTNGGRGASKKLSKVDTLKLAVEYIRRLQLLLDDTSDTDLLKAAQMHSLSNLSSSSSSPTSTASSSYYSTGSPMATIQMQHSPIDSMDHQHLHQLTPTSSTSSSLSSGIAPCSEASISPSPSSYSSDNSYIGQTPSTVSLAVSATAAPGSGAPTSSSQFKYEMYDVYNPEDEELLDCITWWQQQ